MTTIFQLDARGLFCPEPLMLLHRKIREMQVGDILEVVATDPSTERDIPKFCLFLEHELLLHDARENEYFYRIRKAG